MQCCVNFYSDIWLTNWLVDEIIWSKNMEKDKLSTEQIIKQAAMEIFVQDGFDGARMQKIADLAGVNKAMLHYYFSSKDILFEKIFADVACEMVPEIEAIMHEDLGIIEKLKKFVKVHMKQQLCNQKVSAFFFNELTKNPERMSRHFKSMESMQRSMQTFFDQYEREVSEGKLVAYSPMHLFIMMQGLIDYYPIAKPFYDTFLKDFNLDMGIGFEKELPEQVCKLLENALTIK